MTFLRAAWYMASWAAEATETPVARRILDIPLLLFRVGNGEFAAVEDRCPHRAAPLHLGRVVDDAIQCAYHGLRFDRTGACTGAPADFKRAPNIRVRSFPTCEQFGGVWVWMGDAAQADPAELPTFDPFTRCDPRTFISGYIRVAANYQLITDNLLDLSHIPHLHQNSLAAGGPSGSVAQVKTRQDGDHVIVERFMPGARPNVMYATAWNAPRGDRWADMAWQPPASLLLDAGITTEGGPREAGLIQPSAHILTPETLSTTHYFWAFARNFDAINTELTAQVRQTGVQAFEQEDKPIVEAQQARIAEDGERKLLPLTVGDHGGVLARRVLARKIGDDSGR